MTIWPKTYAEVYELLGQHEYRFGHDTNCSCGAPSIWFWGDYCEHIAKLMTA